MSVTNGNRKLVELADRTVETIVCGHGAPLIVLESGLGDDLSIWSEILIELAKRTRTLSYNRPGYGRSTLVSTPRNVRTQADELRNLLRAIGEPAPYLLVGHSLGGLIVQTFAAAHPHEIAGLVLVDPTAGPLGWAGLPADDMATQLRIVRETPAMQAYPASQEFDALVSPPANGHFSGALYTGPVIVLGGWMNDLPNGSSTFLPWRRQQLQEIAQGYPRGELRKIACKHHIHREQPLAVLEAVDAVLAQSITSRGTGRND